MRPCIFNLMSHRQVINCPTEMKEIKEMGTQMAQMAQIFSRSHGNEGNGGRRWKMDDGRRKRNCGSWLMVHDEWFMICFESMG